MARAEDQEAFAARVAELASDYGSAAELARTVGVATSVIRSWSTGVSDPTRSKLVSLSSATKTSLPWLAIGTGPKYGLGGEPLDLDLFQEVMVRDAVVRQAMRVDDPLAQLRDCVRLLLKEVSSAQAKRQVQMAAERIAERMEADADEHFAALDQLVESLAARGRGEEASLPKDHRVVSLNLRTRTEASRLGGQYNRLAGLPEAERTRTMDGEACVSLETLKSQREDKKARQAGRPRFSDDT